MSTQSGPHDSWEQLAVGHALDALEPDDEATFLAHLPGCSICRRVLADTVSVMADLAATVQPVEPPVALWAGIRDEVRRSPRGPIDLPPVVSTPPPAPVAPAPPPPSTVTPGVSGAGAPRRRAGSAPTGPGGRRRPLGRPRVPASRWALPVLAGIVLAALLGLGALSATLLRGNGSGGSASQQADAVLQCVESPGCTPVRLTGSQPGVTAVAMVRGSSVRLLVDGLPPTSAKTEQYVLWQRPATGGPPLAVKGFALASKGRHLLAAGTLPAPTGASPSFAISREPGTTIPAAPSTLLLQGVGI